MTASVTRLPGGAIQAGGIRHALRDGSVLGWRYLKRVPRIPELAIFAIIQSIMFVLLFAYVFGGAIPIPGAPGANFYREYLMPGIFVQTLVFAAGTTAIGMADDMQKGIIDRFRSLPMASSAVLIGRSFSDVIYNAGILVVLMITGYLVGWSVHTSIAEFVGGVALLLLFVYVMSWIGIWLGLVVPSVEVGQQVVFTALFPIVFISNVFVPLQGLPDWLRPVAEWNPVSVITAEIRSLFGNPAAIDPTQPKPTGFPAEQPLLLSLIWIAALLVLFITLGVRRYRSISR
jgi:ABC-2 type transport system permease protein